MVEALIDCVVAVAVGGILSLLLPVRWPTDPK